MNRLEDPYSINIWGVEEGSNFYIGAGRGEESAWVIHLLENPEIRLRLGDELYLLKAVRVSKGSPSERRRGASARGRFLRRKV